MASSSRSFGIDPDGYGPEPQLNREELFAAVTQSLILSSVALTLTVTVVTRSSTAIHGREMGVSVATAIQAAR